MAAISEYLKAIREAIFGEEVRGSICNAIEAMNQESSDAMEYATGARNSAQTYASAASNSATEAKSYAIGGTGTRTGENTDNAKYYKEQAAASANAASGSASAATTKANEASGSAVNASNSAAAAASKANEASESATQAKNAETNASGSAAIAASRASEALSSAENAQTFASQAKDSETAAGQSAEEAKQYSGKPAIPIDGVWQIWDATEKKYVNSGISCAGIEGITLTSGEHTPGSIDIYTVTLTDGKSYDITVHNGRNGAGVGDISGVAFDFLVPAEGWEDGRLAIMDERFLAGPDYQYFLSAEENCRAEFSAYGVEPGAVTENGRLGFRCMKTPVSDLTVHVTRFELAANE